MMSEQWPVKPIMDICEIFTDGNWIESKDQSPSGIRLVQTGNIGEGVFKDRKDKSRYISESTFSRLNCTEIFEGDCLISRLPRPVGRACLIPNTGERMITAVDCSILRFRQDVILPQYFVYYSKSAHYNNQIQPLCTGSTRKRISRKNLGKIEIPIPTLKEQQQIIRILDEVFKQVDGEIIHAEQKLHNGKELFQSAVADIFSVKDDSWSEATLGEVSKFSQGIQMGLKLQKTEPQNGYVRFIRIVDYTQQTDDIRYVEDPGKKYFVSEDDLVMVRYGTPGLIGRGIEGVIANNLFKITLYSDNLLNDYVGYFLSQSHIQKYLSTQGSSTMPALTFKQLKIVKLAIPSLTTQKIIVEKINSLTHNFELLEENYRIEIESLVELKLSILQEVFNGNLAKEIAA